MRLAKHLSHVQLRVQGMHIMFSKMKFKSFQTKFCGPCQTSICLAATAIHRSICDQVTL